MLIMFIKAQKGVNFAFYFCCSPPYLHSDDIYFDNGAGTMVEIWQNNFTRIDPSSTVQYNLETQYL